MDAGRKLLTNGGIRHRDNRDKLTNRFKPLRYRLKEGSEPARGRTFRNCRASGGRTQGHAKL